MNVSELRVNAKNLVPFCLLAFSGASFAEEGPISVPKGAELMFATNFEGVRFQDASKNYVTIGNGNALNLSGADSVLSKFGYPTSFEDFATKYDSNRNVLAYGSTLDDGHAALVADPTGSGRGTVLRFHSSQVDTKSRVQTNFGFSGINSITSSVKVYLPKNIKLLESYPATMDWFTLQEMFIEPDFGANYTVCTSPPLYISNVDCAPNFRTGLDIVKRDGKLVWSIKTDYAGKFLTQADREKLGVQNVASNGVVKADYVKEISSVQVPFGEWITLNYFYERYPNRTDGKGSIKLQMIDSTGKITSIFDLKDVVVTDPLNPDRRYGKIKWMPQKMYTANYFVKHIFSNGGGSNVESFWDDWRLYKGDATLTAVSSDAVISQPSSPELSVE